MNKRPFWYFLGIIALLWSCENNIVFEAKKDFPKRYWTINESAEFTFTIKDTAARYNFYYDIRNTNQYPYRNLYLQYYLQDSTGLVLKKDLNNVQLFNAVTGVPLGDGLGDIFDLQKEFVSGIAFVRPGKYKLRIDQFMRKDTLRNVVSIGLKVAKANSSK